MLSAVQMSGGYVTSSGLPTSSSYASSKLACAALLTLPYGTGGNPIGLALNGQLIDVVRTAARSFEPRAAKQSRAARCARPSCTHLSDPPRWAKPAPCWRASP